MPGVPIQSRWMGLLSQISDVFLTIISFIIAFGVRAQIRTFYLFGQALDVRDYFNSLVIVIVIWWLLFDLQNVYSSQRSPSLFFDLQSILRTVFFGSVALLVVCYLMRIELPPRSVLALFIIVDILLLLVGKAFFFYLRDYLRGAGALRRTVLIVGAGEKAGRYINSLRQNSDWGVDLIGFIENDPQRLGQEYYGAPILGLPQDMPTVLHHNAIDEVVFAVPTRQLEDCVDMLALCEQEGIRTLIISDFFSGLISRVESEVIHGIPVLIYSTTPLKEWQLLAKRIFDILFSSALLLLFLPLFVVIGLAIKLTSKGPIFYRWEVVGLNKKKFTGYKFRTMVVGADRMKELLMDKNEMQKVVFKMKNDPRVTPVGSILRKFSLDELPQLWSVLKGNMSVVGPRPPLVSELDKFESWHRRKLSVKPGLTCLWQISGRSKIRDFDEWVRLDLQYIDKWSLWLDFKILLKTIPVVLMGKGAH
jgi:exopolysaccharide biosynthesis polyprenyl glycosylphosphotransferase